MSLAAMYARQAPVWQLTVSLQNSRKLYNSESTKPGNWTWFKGDPDSPYKVCIVACGHPLNLCGKEWNNTPF